MGKTIVSRIIGFVVTTFVVAMIYGLLLTTVDFMKPGYSPVTSGHHAANDIYNLFGTVTGEIKRNDNEMPTHAVGIAHEIAMPYAVTADLSAILGGKLETGFSSLFHSAARHV